MTNVFDFKTGKKLTSEVMKIADLEFPEPQTGQDYLKICKIVLESQEYEEILCGIMDMEIYNGLEPEFQRIIDNYFSFGDHGNV